jgi:hypothetical protein
LSGRWSWDGAGIVTGGEDGAVKIWSRYRKHNALSKKVSDPVPVSDIPARDGKIANLFYGSY